MINTSFVNLCLAGVTRNVPIIDQFVCVKSINDKFCIYFIYIFKQTVCYNDNYVPCFIYVLLINFSSKKNLHLSSRMRRTYYI